MSDVTLVEHFCGWLLSKKESTHYSEYRSFVFGDSSYAIAPENFRKLDKCPNCELPISEDDCVRVGAIPTYETMVRLISSPHNSQSFKFFDIVRTVADDEHPYAKRLYNWQKVDDPRARSTVYAFDCNLVDLVRNIPGVELVRSTIRGGDGLRYVSRYRVYIDFRFSAAHVRESIEHTLNVFYSMTEAMWTRSQKEKLTQADLISVAPHS